MNRGLVFRGLEGQHARRVDGQRPGLVFIVAEDWYFCSHRLPVACAARDAGLDVTVITREGGHGGRIRSEGFRLFSVDMRRGEMRPLRDIYTLFRLWRILRRERPVIVHNVALKPVLYGSLAARAAGIPCIVNALGGLGFLFSDGSVRSRMLRNVTTLGFQWLLRQPKGRVIVQNPEDRDLLVKEARIDPSHVVMIRGSGVDLAEFEPSPERSGTPIVAMVSRMLRAKGVCELVQAAKRLRKRGIDVRVALVGEPDVGNPATVSERELREWAQSGAVEWWGHQADIASIWRKAHVCVLPSYYREGVPKSLLEAAACGRPIVTSDAPGCREVVQHDVNGLLVPVRDIDALTGAIARLVADRELRERMGRAGRALVEEYFGVEAVVRETMDLYRLLLRDRSTAWQLSEER